MHEKRSRRQFVKGTLGLLGGIAAARIAGLFPEAQPLLAQSSQEEIPIIRPVQTDSGELYAGFLLLPEGTPAPNFIQYPDLDIPIVCGVGVTTDGTQPTAMSKSLDTVEELVEVVEFPIYTFIPLPDFLHLYGASLIAHETGEIFIASVRFQSYNMHMNAWQTTVTIWAQPDFPKPFPLWSASPVEPDRLGVVLEKVNFLPSPGIMIAIPAGYVFHWIENDIYYRLVAENSPS